MSTLWKRDIQLFTIVYVTLISARIITGTINYTTIRRDDLIGVRSSDARTTREILEMYNSRTPLKTSYSLQEVVEHLLQYGALLRVHVLDTFGPLVYDYYDEFSLVQTEALYRVYSDTLERKYNIFDIVPSVLATNDTRPTKICEYIRDHVRTCLKESSTLCTTIERRDRVDEEASVIDFLEVTRRVYETGRVEEYFPGGFTLPAVLVHLKAGRLNLTDDLFSGLLHNVQYDSFDDEVRTAERNVMMLLMRQGIEEAPRGDKRLGYDEEETKQARTVCDLLKSILDANAVKYDPRSNKDFSVLSGHVVREVEAISENIELLGSIYENGTIDVDYLFDLILPLDVVDDDVTAAKDYLVGKIKELDLVNEYLKVEKYEQSGPDQLLMEMLGQMRDIGFAVDIVTSLRAHARFWHQSHMVDDLNDLLELFDAYENLRNVPEYQELVAVLDQIRNHLWNSRNVTVEILCNNPRGCLRRGLEIVLKCVYVHPSTKMLVEELFGYLSRDGSLRTDNCYPIEVTDRPDEGETILSSSSPDFGSLGRVQEDEEGPEVNESLENVLTTVSDEMDTGSTPSGEPTTRSLKGDIEGRVKGYSVASMHKELPKDLDSTEGSGESTTMEVDNDGTPTEIEGKAPEWLKQSLHSGEETYDVPHGQPTTETKSSAESDGTTELPESVAYAHEETETAPELVNLFRSRNATVGKTGTVRPDKRPATNVSIPEHASSTTPAAENATTGAGNATEVVAKLGNPSTVPKIETTTETDSFERFTAGEDYPGENDEQTVPNEGGAIEALDEGSDVGEVPPDPGNIDEDMGTESPESWEYLRSRNVSRNGTDSGVPEDRNTSGKESSHEVIDDNPSGNLIKDDKQLIRSPKSPISRHVSISITKNTSTPDEDSSGDDDDDDDDDEDDDEDDDDDSRSMDATPKKLLRSRKVKSTGEKLTTMEDVSTSSEGPMSMEVETYDTSTEERVQETNKPEVTTPIPEMGRNKWDQREQESAKVSLKEKLGPKSSEECESSGSSQDCDSEVTNEDVDSIPGLEGVDATSHRDRTNGSVGALISSVLPKAPSSVMRSSTSGDDETSKPECFGEECECSGEGCSERSNNGEPVVECTGEGCSTSKDCEDGDGSECPSKMSPEESYSTVSGSCTGAGCNDEKEPSPVGLIPCNNKNPRHRRKLSRLEKVRLLNLVSSKDAAEANVGDDYKSPGNVTSVSESFSKTVDSQGSNEVSVTSTLTKTKNPGDDRIAVVASTLSSGKSQKKGKKSSGSKGKKKSGKGTGNKPRVDGKLTTKPWKTNKKHRTNDDVNENVNVNANVIVSHGTRSVDLKANDAQETLSSPTKIRTLASVKLPSFRMARMESPEDPRVLPTGSGSSTNVEENFEPRMERSIIRAPGMVFRRFRGL